MIWDREVEERTRRRGHNIVEALVPSFARLVLDSGNYQKQHKALLCFVLTMSKVVSTQMIIQIVLSNPRNK